MKRYLTGHPFRNIKILIVSFIYHNSKEMKSRNVLDIFNKGNQLTLTPLKSSYKVKLFIHNLSLRCSQTPNSIS